MAKTTIERRVAALEEASGGGRCPECGGPDEPGDHTTYELVFVDEAEEEWCETCGRQTGIVIRWPEDLP
jgi:hypothetical protein